MIQVVTLLTGCTHPLPNAYAEDEGIAGEAVATLPRLLVRLAPVHTESA